MHHSALLRRKTRLAQCICNSSILMVVLSVQMLNPYLACALPPPEDTPEEVLRTQMASEFYSILDGETLTADEYTELQAILEAGPETPPQLSSEIRHIIFLLRIRKLLKTFIPF